MEDEKQYL